MQQQPQSFYTIRFPDCDPFGHLNNSRYLDYFLNAREDHLRDFYEFRLDDFYKKGAGWMVVGHNIRYLRPAMYNETVCIRSQLIDAGESHLLVELTMWDQPENTCKAICWTQFVPVSLRTGKRDKHDAGFFEFAKSLLVEGIDLAGGTEKRAMALSGSRPVQ